jgi:pseudouridine synthase
MVQGINISDQLYKASSINEIKISSTNSWYCITLREGKNRMIRKMAEALNHKIIRLKRVRIANIRLGNLKSGDCRAINSEEIGILTREKDI